MRAEKAKYKMARTRYDEANDARNKSRDVRTGQYGFEGDFERLCVCGHPLGIHGEAGVVCMNEDKPGGGTGEPCDCEKFRPSKRK